MNWKYKKLKLKDWTTIDRHRYNMQKYLWRKLKSDEVVHHIDWIKSNDDISNLEVISRKEHSRLHYIKWNVHKFTIEDIRKWVKNRTLTKRGISKLSIEMYIEIWYLHYSWLTCRKISKIVSLHHTNIAKIIRWVHWSNEYYNYAGLV